MPRKPEPAAIARLKELVGPKGWRDAPDELEPYLVDFRSLYRGATPLLLLPASTLEVSGILCICDHEGIAVVPQGGNTGYCGGATPDESGTQLLMSLRRMNRVRAVDAANDSMIVEAGLTLAAVQAAAREANRLFPLSLGSEGSAQIGGNLGTNAGGTAVLRYGMMRDLVLGLEVVLPDGRVLSALKGLRKDNTGYDLKSLFIGAEGTLGVITAVCLKLFPLPTDVATALVALPAPQSALRLLALLRAGVGEKLSTFELMPLRAVELTVRHVEGVANPLGQQQGAGPNADPPPAPWYALIELSSANPSQELTELLTEQLGSAAADGVIQDALIAASSSQAQAMWKLRESIPEAQRRHGASLKHDVSVPISAIPALLERGTALAETLNPAGEVVAYGHLGDGNLHFNLSQRPHASAAEFLARKADLEEALFDLVEELGGSFSAEHGIGRLRAAQFARRTDPVEYSVMQALKRALDPKGIMNPGKVLL